MINVGVSLNTSGFDSQDLFDENMKRIKDDLWQYIDYGNIELQSIRELVHINKNTSKTKLVKCLGGDFAWYKGDSRDGLYWAVYDEAFSLSELIHILEHFEVGYKLKYDKYTTMGYNQGDYAEVIVPHILSKEWKISHSDMNTIIDHYFWDAPLRGVITVNNDEHDLMEFIEDEYEWNIDKVKAEIIAFIDNEYSNVPAKQAIHEQLVIALDDINEIKYIY